MGFYASVAPMFDLKQVIPKFAQAAIEVVVQMDKQELFGLLDPLTKIVEQDELDVQSLPEHARTIADIIRAAPGPVQSELNQRFWAAAMHVFQTAGKGWHKGWGKCWKGWKGWKGAAKSCGKGWSKGGKGCGGRESEQADIAPEAKRHCPESRTESVHETAMSALMSHPDPKIREAAKAAMEEAEGGTTAASCAVPTSLDATTTYQAQGADVSTPMPEDCAHDSSVVASLVVSPKLSAALYGDPVLELHSAALELNTTAATDVTHEWNAVLSQFPSMTQAVLLGRVVRKVGGSQAVMLARVSIANDGTVPWPAATNLRIAAGDALGCEVIPAGEVPSGGVLEAVLKLDIPEGPGANRSAWALESQGEPFGPMLILEIQPAH